MATLNTTPPKPILSLTESSDISLKLSWSLDDLLRYDILRYDVHASTTSDPSQELACLNRPVLSRECQLRGLTPETEYNMSVRACSRAGCGAYGVLLASTSPDSSSSLSFTVVFLVFLFLLFIVCCSANYDILWPTCRDDCIKGRLGGVFRDHNITSINLGRSHRQQDQLLRLTEIHSTVATAPSDEITPAPSVGPPTGASAAVSSDSPPPYQAVVRAPYDKRLLHVEVHDNSQVASPQCDDKQMASPQCDDEQMVSPQCDDEQMASPQCDDEQMASPQCDDEQMASPQCDDKQMASPQCDDKQTASSQCDDKEMASPQCDDKEMASPQCDDKQTASPQCDDKEMASPQCDDRQLVSFPCDKKQMFECDNYVFTMEH